MENTGITDCFQQEECPSFNFPFLQDFDDPSTGLEVCNDLDINKVLFLDNILEEQQSKSEFQQSSFQETPPVSSLSIPSVNPELFIFQPVNGTNKPDTNENFVHVDSLKPNQNENLDDVGNLKTVYVECDVNNNEKEFVAETGCMYTGAPMPYFLKIVWLEGRYVQIAVDFKNKPLLFPAGAHFRKLPSVPIPACPYASSVSPGAESGETVYVNTRQSHRILKRRKDRANLEAKLAARGITPRAKMAQWRKSRKVHEKCRTQSPKYLETDKCGLVNHRCRGKKNKNYARTVTQNLESPLLPSNMDNVCFVRAEVDCVGDENETIIID